VIETTGTTNPSALVGQPTIIEVEPNQSNSAPFYGVRQNLDVSSGFGWSLLSDSEVQGSGITGSVAGIPYIRVSATGSLNDFDYYSFFATAGSRVILDIDRTNASTDTHIFLLDSSGNQLAQNDNSASLDAGSTSLFDSFIDFTVSTTGTFIVAVGENGSFVPGAGIGIAGNPLDVGDAYTLNVSVAGHLTADYSTPLGVTGPTFTTGEVTIPAGQTFVPVNINPVDDKLIEGNETFRVRLINPVVSGNGATSVGITGPTVGEITIQDDDSGIVGGTGPSSPAVEPASPAVPQNINITLPFPSSQPVTVRFTVTGTASNPNNSFATLDYVLSSPNSLTVDTSTTLVTQLNDFTIIIPAGQTTASVTITPIADNLLELQETVVITPTAIVAGSQGGLITASNIGITALINDSDVGRVINTNLGADLSGSEPGGAIPADISFFVKLDPSAPSVFGLAADGDITVNWSITTSTGVTAIAFPAANADYRVLAVAGEVTVNANGTSGTVTIKAGTTGTFIPVLVLNDSIVEGLENLTLTIAAPVAAGGRNATLGSPVSQMATIADDPDTAVVTIAASTAIATETGPVNGVFTVTQSALSSTDTIVRVTIAGPTVSVPAARGHDPDAAGLLTADYTVTGTNVVLFTAAAGGATTTTTNAVYSVTIPAGSLSTNIVIVPINDDEVETLLENVTATLQAATISPTDPDGSVSVVPGTTAVPGNTATLTIQDNDAAKFTFSNLAPTSTENNSVTNPFTADGNMLFNVTLDKPVDVDVTVVITLSGGTAVGAPLAGGTTAASND